jgi:WD40 repeat protein
MIGDGPRVFISYSRKDREFALALRRRLEEAGFSLWQDLSDVTPGQDWWVEIIRAIDVCEHMVLVVSDDALRSDTCRREWRYARQVGTSVLPVICSSAFDFSRLPSWMRRLDFVDSSVDERWNRLLSVLRGPANLPRVPQLYDPPPGDYVPRSKEFDRLKSLLLQRDCESSLVALRGASGYGKTTLVQALCDDDQIQEFFFDGILWVTLGENPGDLTAKLVDLIEALSGSRPGFETEEMASRALGDMLRDRNCLIVIDDLWRRADASLFLRGGKKCARLISTLNDDVLPDDAVRVSIDAMNLDEASKLLRHGLVDIDQEELKGLALRLDAWPLLLRLANAFLRAQCRQNLSTSEAIQRAEDRFEKKGLIAFNRRDPQQRHDAADKCIQLSFELLSPGERERFAQLAAFAENTSIPISTIANYWRNISGIDDLDVEGLLDRFADLSLLRGLDKATGQANLHTVVRVWIAQGDRAADLKQLHGQLCDVLLKELRTSDSQTPVSAYLLQNLPLHLVKAGRTEELDQILHSYQWLSTKLSTSGLPALLADFALTRTQETRLIGETLRLAAHIIVGNPEELASQLLSRLEVSVFPHLHREALDAIRRPALIPVQPSLAHEGNGLLQTLVGHTDRVTSVVALPSARAVSAAADGSLLYWDLESGISLGVLNGHTDGVTSIVCDGRDRVISSSMDGSVRVWSLPDRKCTYVLEGHSDGVISIQTLPGNRAFSCSLDGTIRIWNLAHGSCERVLEGHGEAVRVVLRPNAHPDFGERLVSGGDDGTVRMWDVSSGRSLAITDTHTAPITGLMSLSQGRVVSLSEDHTLRIWSVQTGLLLQTLEGHSDWVKTVAVIDDQTIISGSYDQTLRVWDLRSGETLYALLGHGGWIQAVRILSVSLAVSCSDDGTLRVWNTNAGKCVRILTGHTNRVRGLLPINDRLVLSWAYDNSIRYWDVAEGACLHVFDGHTDCVREVVMTPQGQLLSCSDDRSLRLWELSHAVSARTRESHSALVRSMVFMSCGRLVSASDDRMLRVWDAATGELLGILRGHEHSVRQLAAFTDTKVLSASDDGAIRLWDVESGVCLRTLDGHLDQVTGIAIDEKGGRTLTCSNDHTVRLWDLADGAQSQTLRGHVSEVTCVIFCDKGRALSGSLDRSLRLWDLTSGQCLVSLEGHTDQIVAVTQVAEALALSASDDRTLRLWDLSERRCVRVLEGHDGAITSMALLKHQRAVSSSTDNTLRLWDLETGDCKMTYSGHTGHVTVVAPTDEAHFLSGSDDSTLRLWNVYSSRCVAVWHCDAPVTSLSVAGSELFAAGDAHGRVHLVALSGGGSRAIVHERTR